MMKKTAFLKRKRNKIVKAEILQIKQMLRVVQKQIIWTKNN